MILLVLSLLNIFRISAHLFGNTSVTQMLQDRYSNDYYIEQIDLASPNFPYQSVCSRCSFDEFPLIFFQELY